jgi:hypothetical protein
MLDVRSEELVMNHRIVGFSAVILGLPVVAACHNSSSPPPSHAAAAEPAPAQQTAGAGSEAQECEENAQPAPAPTAMAAEKPHHHHYRQVLNCPMDYPGTTAAFVEIQGYPSIDFITTSDPVQLRKRVHAFMEPQQPSGTIEPGVSADTQGSGGREMKPDVTYTAVRSRFEDIPHGIRVSFIPADDAGVPQAKDGQVAAVHAAVAATAAQLADGNCEDMHIHGIKIKNVQ